MTEEGQSEMFLFLRRRLKLIVNELLINPMIRQFLERLPFLNATKAGLIRTHPFDKQYGVDTSGTYPPELIQSTTVRAELISPYLGAEPNVTRDALSALPDFTSYKFVDIGCGKGRVIIIGSEFPFKEIVGIELSLKLAKIARANVDRIKSRYANRPAIQVITGNAIDCLPTSGFIAFYIYHSFGQELISQLVKKLEVSLQTSLEHTFVIYHNPVWGQIMDNSPHLCRWYASSVLYDPFGIPGSSRSDSVVIWQSVKHAWPGAHAEANRQIIVRNRMEANLGNLDASVPAMSNLAI
jgi:SAM-dependent methyltransferase